MVRQGDFEISLVHADTKLPFKEHIKDGNVYVEVEPDEEYFICMQRVGNAHQGILLAVASVDEKYRGYKTAFSSFRGAFHGGLLTVKDGISKDTALKFTKPRLTAGQSGQQQSSGMLTGKVEATILTGILNGYHEEDKNFQSTWEAPSIDLAQAGGLAEKKRLRSGEGLASISKENYGPLPKCRVGSIVDVITLNYCAALGLIQVGVLPKPPFWDYHRMLQQQTAQKRSSTTSATTASPTVSVPTIEPIRLVSPLTGRVEEQFDLTNMDDDEEED